MEVKELQSDGGGVAAMCMGGIDPKYGLRDLEAQFSARQITVAKQKDTNREPTPGLIGWAFALIARFRQKDASHV